MAINRADYSAWAPAVARYSGIALAEGQASYVHDGVYAVLNAGVPAREAGGRASLASRRVRNAGILQSAPAWSADGRRIAYVEQARGGRARVRVANVAGGAQVDIASADAALAGEAQESPAWSPDGKWLAFSWEHDGDAELYLARADGSRPRRLTRAPGADWLPRWVR